MKGIIDTFIPWVIIIIFLTILFIVYNQADNNHQDLGEDAPIPSELHPVVEKNKNKLIEQAAEINIDVVITDETRSFSRQDELYEQGRSMNGSIVTNAKGGESYHNYGLAIDYALIDNSGNVIWDIHYDGNGNGDSDWFEVAELAKDLGFEWGGDWTNFPDYPHLQMSFGLTINQLQNGIRPDPESVEEAHK
ncbi:M15 family metallopeptidase [Virgibacillus ainsalahensis]